MGRKAWVAFNSAGCRLPLNGMRKNIFYVLILVAVFMLFGIYFVSSSGTEEDKCASITPRADGYPCYMAFVKDVIEERGVDAGFEYAERMRPTLDYQAYHMMMHQVGRSAYSDLGDLGRALAFLDTHTKGSEFDFELDGYRHGLFEVFFDVNGTRSAPDLAKEACSEYFDETRKTDRALDVADIYGKVPQSSENEANQCFHGIGHALMYAQGNDIYRALPLCDEMPQAWQRDWCYYGAFMQYTFNLWPRYVPEVPKPVENESMTVLCNTVSESQQYACAHLVGRAYLNTVDRREPDEDARRALLECNSISPAYREACVVETAAFALPIPFKGKFKDMFEQCHVLETNLRPACVYGAASGVRQGAGGREYMNTEICQFAALEFAACSAATGRGYTLRF